MKLTLFLFLILGVFSLHPAHADCYQDQPFCFNGTNTPEKRVPLLDGVKAATGGQAFLKKFPKPTVGDVREACRAGDIKGDVCHAPKHNKKLDGDNS